MKHLKQTTEGSFDQIANSTRLSVTGDEWATKCWITKSKNRRVFMSDEKPGWKDSERSNEGWHTSIRERD